MNSEPPPTADPLPRLCPTAVTHTRIREVSLDPQRCRPIYCHLPHKEPNAGPSLLCGPTIGRCPQTETRRLSSPPCPMPGLGFVFVTPSCFAICNRSRHQMFKKRFGKKSKLVRLLDANLISSVRRMGSRILRPSMSSQPCRSPDSCPVPYPQPLIPPTRVLECSRVPCHYRLPVARDSVQGAGLRRPEGKWGIHRNHTGGRERGSHFLRKGRSIAPGLRATLS